MIDEKKYAQEAAIVAKLLGTSKYPNEEHFSALRYTLDRDGYVSIGSRSSPLMLWAARAMEEAGECEQIEIVVTFRKVAQKKGA